MLIKVGRVVAYDESERVYDSAASFGCIVVSTVWATYCTVPVNLLLVPRMNPGTKPRRNDVGFEFPAEFPEGHSEFPEA